MQKEEIKALFDQQAASYDKQWARMAPLRDCLHFLLKSVFEDLPSDARILCVGAGTGAEIAYLAKTFERWRFTAVDPSGAMLEVCRKRAEVEGYAARCDFHEGYVESLAIDDMHDGTIQQGDTWLQHNINPYVQWAKTNNSLLIVTWDEDDSSQSNQIPTIFVGPMVKSGRYAEKINHYNVLRTLEDMYGLPAANNSASATSIADCWQTASSSTLSTP